MGAAHVEALHLTCAQQSNLTAAVQSGNLKVSQWLSFKWNLAICRGRGLHEKQSTAVCRRVCADSVGLAAALMKVEQQGLCETGMGAAHAKCAASLHLRRPQAPAAGPCAGWALCSLPKRCQQQVACICQVKGQHVTQKAMLCPDPTHCPSRGC